MAHLDALSALSVHHLTKKYSGVTVLDRVDLSVRPGEILALLGENGAGKSTLMKILSGIHRPDDGRIEFFGREIELRGPKQAQALGINIIHQELNIVANRTVAQNIFLGREPPATWLPAWSGWIDIARMNADAQGLLREVGLASLAPSARCAELSTAQQQLVEIARAISTESKIILMDEPTSSLSAAQVESLFQLMRRLRSGGLGVILTTHRIEEAFEIADRIVILRDGKLVADRPAKETRPQEVIQWMVGRPVGRLFPERSSAPHKDLLQVNGLSGGKVREVSFAVRRGEVFGLGGLMGSGRTEVARLLFGADRAERGDIVLNGRKARIASPEDAVALGVGFVPEDRKLQALILDLAVRQNMVLASLRSFSRGGVIRRKAIERSVGAYVRDLNVQLRSASQHVRFLSGGNQQKVVLAKWLMLSPRILILDEPTRGIDVGAKAEIYALIDRLASTGIAIVMISSELPELLGMSDRVGVMSEGRLVGVLDRREATPETVMRLASMGKAALEGGAR